MANNTIGTGAVILTANADKLVATLGKAEQKVSEWAKKTESIGAKASGGFADRFGDGLKEIGTGALRHIGEKLAELASDEIKNAIDKTLEWSKTMDGVAHKIDLIGDLMESNRAKRDEWLDVPTGRADRLSALNKEMEKTGREQQALIAQRESLERLIASMEATTGGASWKTAGLSVAGLVGLDPREKTLEQIDALNQQIDGTFNRLHALAEEKGKLANPANDAALIKSIDAQVEAYGRQAQAIRDNLSGVDELTRAQQDAFEKGLSGALDQGQAWRLMDAIADARLAKMQERAVEIAKITGQFAGGFNLLQDQTPKSDLKLAGAFEIGSTEAYSVLANNFADQLSGLPANRQTEAIKETNAILRKLLSKFDDLRKG